MSNSPSGRSPSAVRRCSARSEPRRKAVQRALRGAPGCRAATGDVATDHERADDSGAGRSQRAGGAVHRLAAREAVIYQQNPLARQAGDGEMARADVASLGPTTPVSTRHGGSTSRTAPPEQRARNGSAPAPRQRSGLRPTTTGVIDMGNGAGMSGRDGRARRRGVRTAGFLAVMVGVGFAAASIASASAPVPRGGFARPAPVHGIGPPRNVP
jgi:hypothetical protein